MEGGKAWHGAGVAGATSSRLANCKELKVDFMPDQPRSMQRFIALRQTPMRQKQFQPPQPGNDVKVHCSSNLQFPPGILCAPVPTLLGSDERQQQAERLAGWQGI